MRKIYFVILTFILFLMLGGCEQDKGEANNGKIKTKELYGTYEGSGTVTKYEAQRTKLDIDNQRYLFMSGDIRETQDDFDGIVITIEEDNENTIWYSNNNTGLNGTLAYNSDSGLWEHTVDYPLGTLSVKASFSKQGGEINGKFIFTQSFEREHFENPEPSDGVNEFTLYLTKTK